MLCILFDGLIQSISFHLGTKSSDAYRHLVHQIVPEARTNTSTVLLLREEFLVHIKYISNEKLYFAEVSIIIYSNKIKNFLGA